MLLFPPPPPTAPAPAPQASPHLAPHGPPPPPPPSYDEDAAAQAQAAASRGYAIYAYPAYYPGQVSLFLTCTVCIGFADFSDVPAINAWDPRRSTRSVYAVSIYATYALPTEHAPTKWPTYVFRT